MASAAVYAAFSAAIAAAWPHSTIRLPNSIADAPISGVAFLTVTYPFARERQASFGAPGANRWRTEGGVRITLSIPAGDDPDDAASPWLTRLDALRDALRGKIFSGVQTFGASSPIMDESSDQGAFYVISFAVEYFADVIG